MSTPSAPAVPRRSTAVAQKRGTFASKKPHSSESVSVSKSQNPNQLSVGAERTVKKLRLSKALTIPEGTSVSDACRRMSSRRVDAVLLTDVNALLSGIVTDKVETSSDAVNDTENMIMQRFWDSTLALEAPDDCDTQSYLSGVVTIDGFETRKSVYPSLSLGNSFAFKFEDLKGRVHRFNCGSENLDELLYAVMQRVNTDNDRGCLQILYEDDEGDKVILETNGDLLAAVTNAKSAGLKALRLHLDYPESCESSVRAVDMGSRRWVSGRTGMFAGVMLVAGVGVLLCLRRPKLWSSKV